ncbi:MAG: OmpH family outer membrane protein [Odoribacter sp.]|nr:OmpH family outer membrane protein [Odoribacter sp.]
MKNAIKLFVLVTFTLVAMNVSAQQKLGHIETQKLIQAMPEMAAAQKTMQDKQSEVEKELTNMQEQFKTKLNEYSQNAKTYSDVIRTSKEQELQELQQRIQRFQEIAMENLEQTQKELMQPIMDKALNAIKAVAKENAYTYIFDMSSGVVLYVAENSEDILPLVKKKLGLQ